MEAELVPRGLLLARGDESRLRSRFERAFTIAGATPRPHVFEQIWRHKDVTHAELLARAKYPQEWVNGSARRDAVRSSPALGEACPTCGFPTFDWHPNPDTLDGAVVCIIRESVADWSPRDGICRQCAETFLSKHAERTAWSVSASARENRHVD